MKEMTEAVIDSKNLQLKTQNNIENFRSLLDSVCNEVAKRFNLYKKDESPRKASIIDALSRFTCPGCIYRKLSEKSASSDVDAIYKECHKLAVNILVERLYQHCLDMGYTVAISTEAELEYGKVDILINVTKYGINLKHYTNELIIELKTENSLSLSQLFRYLLDVKGNTIIVWRIRKRQILVFNIDDLKPLLTEFVLMIYLRANRLLSSSHFTCEHAPERDYRPTQEDLQITIQDFAQSLLETLPHVLSITFGKLGLHVQEVKT